MSEIIVCFFIACEVNQVVLVQTTKRTKGTITYASQGLMIKVNFEIPNPIRLNTKLIIFSPMILEIIVPMVIPISEITLTL